LTAIEHNQREYCVGLEGGLVLPNLGGRRTEITTEASRWDSRGSRMAMMVNHFFNRPQWCFLGSL
jgi:hypothetical protein